MPHDQRSGLLYAVGAYILWGCFPLYLKLLSAVPPVEFVAWRVILTLPVCLILIAVLRQFAQLRASLANRKVWLQLTASALMIGGNWLLYVWAVQTGHVLAASLGYYINPLVNVLAGTLFLGERLSRLKWIAVALAAVGVAILAWEARATLGVALGLAILFAGYGLVRKLAPVESLPGLTIESIVLMLPAAGVIWYFVQSAGSTSFGIELRTDVLLLLAGLVTAVPLLLFAVAARRMEYSTLGFVQYIAPTLVFVQGLFLFGEPLEPAQLATFVLIWTAIAIYSYDLLKDRAARRAAAPPIG